MQTLIPIVAAMIGAGTPLVFAGLGELVAERSGVINLGVEGMMLVGAISAFAITSITGSPLLGITAAALASAALALMFGFLTLTLMANQVAAGLALTIFGVGLSAYLGKSYSGTGLSGNAAQAVPMLSDVPILGPLIFSQNPLVYLSWCLVAAVSWFLYRSRLGLMLRAVGESPATAHMLGYPVIPIRYAAILFGGLMAGLAGAFLAVVSARLWLEGMTAGRGWIAVALVVFASWRPGRLVVGAYLFGGVTIAQFFAQGAGMAVPAEVMSALPYLATIIVLVLISSDVAAVRRNAPVSLGKAYLPET
jgi:general nucleoside transport system permease protein